VVTVAVLLELTGWRQNIREAVFDARFKAVQRAPTGQIALVEIDRFSLDEIGVWPWGRSRHADLVRKLDAAGAAAIAFDVDFSAQSTPADDDAFASALKDVGGSVVLASFRQPARPQDGADRIILKSPLPIFAEAAWPALADVQPDRDGAIRRYITGAQVNGEWLPSIAAVLADKPLTRDSAFRIDYGIRARDLPRVSYADVLSGRPEALAVVRDRKVIVSGTAVELGDRFVVPGGKIFPGSVIQALAAESLIQSRALRELPDFMAPGAVGLLCLLFLALWSRTRTGVRMWLAGGLAVSAEAAALAVQAKWPIAVDTSLFLAACVTYAIAIVVENLDLQTLMRAAAERRFKQIALSLTDGLACMDERGAVTFWNPGAGSIFGYDEQEMLGKPFSQLLAPDPDTLQDFPGALDAKAGELLELRGRRKSGETFYLEASFSRWRGANGPQFGAVLRDISRRKADEARILQLATIDQVTGAPNRNTLLARLDNLFADPSPARSMAALVLVSIDQFEQISNLHGGYNGDVLLKAAARRISHSLGRDVFMAKLDGPEFAVLAPGSLDGSRGAEFAALLETNLQTAPLRAGEDRQRVTVSIGVAHASDAQSPGELLGNAQLALAKARRAGCYEMVHYHPSMREETKQRVLLEADLRRALEDNEFELFYQPQFALASRRLVGAEALIRWNSPERGLVGPSEFMPVVNGTSLAESVAEWVLNAACAQAAAWNKRGLDIRVGVNLCQSQFLSGNLSSKVARAIRNADVPPHLLEFEVTEDIILGFDGDARDVLASIRDLGCGVAFDDFGTGYGSLSYLKSFPIDRIKIDQSFVRSLRTCSEDAAIVQAVLDLARAFNLSAIAEGIEDEETVRLLIDMGCAEGQGYHFSKPVSAAHLERALLTSGPLALIA
jgi:diguanylate cyclase (GGDEF)-like protein/PAS domain S-box-containing protein